MIYNNILLFNNFKRLIRVYEIENGNLNKFLKRNSEIFLKTFCFQLINNGHIFLVFQMGWEKTEGGWTTLSYQWKKYQNFPLDFHGYWLMMSG